MPATPSRAGASWPATRGPAGEWIRCAALADVPGVAHAFSTRRGAAGAERDLAAATRAAERTRWSTAAGLSAGPVRLLRQVHGTGVLPAGAAAPAAEPEGDGWVAGGAERAAGGLAVKTADCVPLLIAERGGAAIAAIHAGWRGVAAGILGVALRRLVELGAPAGGLVVALGPAIGGCCYEVGLEVLQAVCRASGAGDDGLALGSAAGPRIDLRDALRRQCLAAGVEPGALHTAPWCTRCASDRFFSYRREGAGCGRQLALIGWGPDAVA